MVCSRARPEATREQLIGHLTRRLDPATWDLIRKGVLSHVLYKTAEEPGFFAVLNAPNLEQAKAVAEAGTERLEVFELEVVPVNQFSALLNGPEGDVLKISSLTWTHSHLCRAMSFRTCLRGPSAGRGT